MKRRIIVIDEEKCNGCGLCAQACHEGAISIVEGKARLLREDYCDGLGDCLPACPMNAISFEGREAPAYDASAVMAAKKAKQASSASGAASACQDVQSSTEIPSRLANFPVQLKLVPENAPYFDGAQLLIAADCTAYAYADFHRRFMGGRITLIGCPKLDGINYAEKLTAVFRNNDICGITVTRMTVPCCGGLIIAVKEALKHSGKDIPLTVVTIRSDGQILK